MLKLSNNHAHQTTLNGFSHAARESFRGISLTLVNRLRDVSFMAALISNFHVLRLYENGSTIPELNSNFFYQCLNCATGKGVYHSQAVLQALEASPILADGKKLDKLKMENAVHESYLLFRRISLADVLDQSNIQQNPSHPRVHERDGLTYFMPLLARDMVQNVANLVSSNFIQVKQREIMMKMRSDKPSLSMDHTKKLSLHLFKLIHSPHGTFWPTSVPQSEEMIEYMTTEYG